MGGAKDWGELHAGMGVGHCQAVVGKRSWAVIGSGYISPETTGMVLWMLCFYQTLY